MAICAFYKRRRNHMQLISGYKGGQYLRLMAISAVEMFGTIPLGTFFIVVNARSGVIPWKGWASMHNHYSTVEQVAGFTWKNVPEGAIPLEMFRWSLVACAFLFFALYGFAVEAREQYYCLYKLLARRIGTSSSASHGAPHVYVVRSLCCLRPDSLGLVHIFFLQYSTSPLCEDKRWRHESYHDSNG
jgi:pheromone a factor receptor